MGGFLHVIPGWLELISLAFCIGVVACRLWFFRPEDETGHHGKGDRLAGMWWTFAIAVFVMIACSVSNLVVRSAEMSGTSILSVLPVLPTVLFRTHFGKVWIVRVAAEVTSLVFLGAFIKHRHSRVFLLVLLGLVLLVAATESATGHAADAGDLSLPEIADWLHLVGASLWGGGLLVLSFVVLPRLLGGKLKPSLIARVAARFSLMAGIAVGMVGLTALYNAFLYVGTVEALRASAYGWTVIAKICLFAVLINLGGFNRYVAVPLLQEWAGARKGNRALFTRLALRFFPRAESERAGDRGALRFHTGVKIEAGIFIAVLLCASLLRHQVPARHAGHVGHQTGQTHSMPHHNGM